MGRNRKPTAILDANGAFLANPDRKRPNEPSARSLGSAPKWLSKEEKRVWKELVKQAAPGVLMSSDRSAFELLVRLTCKMRTEFAAMTGAQMGQFISLCSRFAMTPADRSKVSVAKPKESVLSAFMKRKEAPAPPAEAPAVVN